MFEVHMNSPPEVIFNLTYLVLSVVVSWVYWRKIRGTIRTRLLASCHSISLLIILILALLFGLNGFNSLSFQAPFTIILLMPIASVLYSLKVFDGDKRIHTLHLWNLVALIWTWFIGSMAVSGDWL